MNGENRDVTAVVAVSETGLVPVPEKPLGYWARAAQKYRTAWMILCFVLAVFLVIFAVLCSHVFTYDSLFYFGRDLRTMTSLADIGESALYYDYESEHARPVSYRGGIAVVHETGVDVYDGSGELLLTVTEEVAYQTPRIAVSRDYLVAYDFGGTSFCVCNSYDKLFSGETENPIYAVSVSDAGYIAVITGSETALSEVLLYDAHFNLKQRFYRAAATVSAAVSNNGRTVTLVGATAEGALVDVYMIGDETPLSTTTLHGFPLVAGYTSGSKLAVVTDAACYALSTEGRVYETVDFGGATLAAYSIDENGIALALETDRLHAVYRVLALDKKGRVMVDMPNTEKVVSLALSDDRLWLLGSERATCVDLSDGEALATMEIAGGALGIVALHDKAARVLYPAEALRFQVN